MTRREALEYFREELKDGKCSDTCPICNAMEWAIKALEERDIVYCKDCKWYTPNYGGGCTRSGGMQYLVSAEEYCSKGECKEKTDANNGN